MEHLEIKLAGAEIATAIGLNPRQHASSLLYKAIGNEDDRVYVHATHCADDILSHYPNLQPIWCDCRSNIRSVLMHKRAEIVIEAHDSLCRKINQSFDVDSNDRNLLIEEAKKMYFCTYGKKMEKATLATFRNIVGGRMRNIIYDYGKPDSQLHILRQVYNFNLEDVVFSVMGTVDGVVRDHNGQNEYVIEIKNRLFGAKVEDYEKIQVFVYMMTHDAKTGYLVQHVRRGDQPNIQVVWCDSKQNIINERTIMVNRNYPESRGIMHITKYDKVEAEEYWRKIILPRLKKFATVAKYIRKDASLLKKYKDTENKSEWYDNFTCE
jgi:hypothetical protein